MKIGINFYSETGHTKQACQDLAERFKSNGHDVFLNEITVEDVQSNKTLKDIPSMDNYDILILGTPVQGFSLPVPMVEYLKKTQMPKKQKLGVIITQYFKVSWLGANHTMKQLLNGCAYANPDLYGYSVVHWSSKRRAEQLIKAIDKLTNLDL